MHLHTNIKHLRRLKKLSQTEMAELLGSKKSNISHYEIGNSEPRIEILNKYSQIFGFSIDDLINKDLSVIEDIETKREKVRISNANILVPIKAQAGYLDHQDQEYIDQLPVMVAIPGIKGEARTFEIEGDSMVPVLLHGDLVSGNKVEDPHSLKNKRIYVIVAPRTGICAKYIERHSDGLHLISEDSENYNTIICPYEDVKEIWEVAVRITSHLSEPPSLTDKKPLEQRIKRIEEILNIWKK